MKIDPKKFYWFRQVGNGTPLPLKYVPRCKCFISTEEIFPELEMPTGFTDLKNAMEKMKDEFEYFGSVRTDSRDPNTYAAFGSDRFGKDGPKHFLVNGRKATEYLVRLKIEGSNG